MIDPNLFTVESLLAAFLADSHGNVDRWRKFADILPEYMPPYPSEDTKPKCVVRYSYAAGGEAFLRYGRGPVQHHFWDIYGEDYQTPELALMALLVAPVPPGLCEHSEWKRWHELEREQGATST